VARYAVMRLLSAFLLLGFLPAAEKEVIVVRGPTVVAFIPAYTEDQLKANPGLNELIGDFQEYAGRVTAPFARSGIEFHVIAASSFQLRIGKRRVTYRPGGPKVGYYFAAPGKKPRIQEGVDTDDHLYQIARDYFGITMRP
jgi:hypothetical protein